MIEVLAIISACKAAHAGIRECVDLYQDFKKDGKDVSDILNEVGTHLGAFFTHQESYKEAEKEAKKNPLPKNISINEEAMNRIIRQQQIEQMETDLREMIIYQLGMPGMWSKFTEMREIVKKEREKVEREQKKPLRWLLSKGDSSLTNGRLELHCQQVYSYCLQPLLFLCTESI
jgi:hypothetical protein